jgi:hypothetical protein
LPHPLAASFAGPSASSAHRFPVKWSSFLAVRILEAPQRTLVRGPTFIRLLARLTDVDVAPPHPLLSDRLSEWIDWTRAVALSRALDGRTAGGIGGPNFGSAEETAYASMRASLTSAIIGGDGLCTPSQPAGDSSAHEDVDYAVFRQHCQTMQRRMQATTGQLRGRLRDMLAGTSAEMARLAEVDALMESVLSPREHALLGAVPALLGQHFERLRLAAQRARDDAPAAAPGTWLWLDVFRRDMQGALLTELDVRFLPLEGLLAALRTHSQGRHVQTSA